MSDMYHFAMPCFAWRYFFLRVRRLSDDFVFNLRIQPKLYLRRNFAGGEELWGWRKKNVSAHLKGGCK